ncbi:MAG TPA: calcium-binding protein [Solirubrobacteraceae bacterium]|nr:calcium-binding protein [Solirubrobacteraceae bacterium]
MRPITNIAVAGALALAAATIPAAAEAATVSYEGGTAYYRAAPGEKNSTGPSLGLFDTSSLRFSDQVPIDAPADRCQPYDGWVECEMPQKVVFELGDGDDFVSFSFAPPSLAAEVYGGDGADSIEGYVISAGPLAQVLDGGAGNDRIDGDKGNDIVRGGPGTDELEGGAGSDTVEGGEGDDLLMPDGFADPSADTVDGGPGIDTVSDFDQPSASAHPRLNISFDGAANDGRPGENDNLVGVEKLDLSVSGTFAGGPGDDDFFVRSNLDRGDSTVTGGPGNDTLKGHDHVETIDGGPGDDRVEGGYNNDVLTGGPGKDTIFGDSTTDTCNFLSCKIPFGNDVIYARDGQVDSIDCGPGEDRAVVDAIDVVANCENVEGGAGPGNGPGQNGGEVTLNGPKSYTRKALRKGIAVAWDCTAACTVKLTLTADKKTAKKLGTKLIASGKGSIARAGKVKFRAKLTGSVKRRIARLRSGHATVALAVTEAGATQRYTRQVALKR